MITLKKSFEIQNLYTGLFNAAIGILNTSDVRKITQEHMRSKANPDAADETVVMPKSYDSGFNINEIITFVCHIQREAEKLTRAINIAKHYGTSDFDTMVSTNRKKRDLLATIETMARLKSSEKMSKGTATKFNAEGNQVSYLYDIKEVSTIDYDRNMVKSIVSDLRKEVEDTSAAIDRMQFDAWVDYDPKYDIGDNLEDAMDKYFNGDAGQ